MKSIMSSGCIVTAYSYIDCAMQPQDIHNGFRVKVQPLFQNLICGMYTTLTASE